MCVDVCVGGMWVCRVCGYGNVELWACEAYSMGVLEQGSSIGMCVKCGNKWDGILFHFFFFSF